MMMVRRRQDCSRDKVVNILEQQEDKAVMGVSTVQGMASGWRRDNFCYKLQGWTISRTATLHHYVN